MDLLPLLLLLLVASVPLPAADWLAGHDRSAAWQASTARARDLLDKVDWSQPVPAAWRQRISERCAHLAERDEHGWQGQHAITFLEEAAEDLSAGRTPLLRHAGQATWFPYWSPVMRRYEAIRIVVPSSYDPQADYTLIVCYKLASIDGRSGEIGDGIHPSPQRAADSGCFYAWSTLSRQIKGRMMGDVELREVSAALARDSGVSADRVVLTGGSDGGFTALWLAGYHPDLVAGIMPSVANWQYSNIGHVGLFNVPTLVVDGWRDSGYVERNFTRFHALSNMGYPIELLIGQHGHKVTPFTEADYHARLVDWAQQRRRDRKPQRLRYATWNLAWNGAHWLRIERMSAAGLPALIDARAADARVDMQVSNVAALTLITDRAPLNQDEEITVMVNGEERYRGPCRPDITITVEAAPDGRFAKNETTPGGYTVAMEQNCYGGRDALEIPGNPWLWVKPDGGSEAQQAFAAFAPDQSLADSALDANALADHNLILLGGPRENQITAQAVAQLPIRFLDDGGFAIGPYEYHAPGTCVRLLHPNPWNPERYLLLYASVDPIFASEHNFYSMGRTMGRESSWSLSDGDCVVYLPNETADKKGNWRSREYTFVFTSEWRVADEVLAQAEEAFAPEQIHDIEAAALRRACDVDGALIASPSKPWQRWNDIGWAAGPIRSNDVWALQMPEFISTCLISGAQLRALLANVSAWSGPAPETLVADRDYKIAIDSSALHDRRFTWQADDVGIIPHPTHFADIEAVAANPHVHLPIRELRQTAISRGQALIDYLRAEGSVRPDR